MVELFGFPIMCSCGTNDFILAEVKQASNRGCTTIVKMHTHRSKFPLEDIV
jgi:hypothetical protein